MGYRINVPLRPWQMNDLKKLQAVLQYPSMSRLINDIIDAWLKKPDNRDKLAEHRAKMYVSQG